ncbi:MAG: VCBS repeat-containing protein [Chloroflexi bacterium]|nr:VCBS repeat-containing protein [Chloroflexota bacterium]
MNKLTTCLLVLLLLAAGVGWQALRFRTGQAWAARQSIITVSGTITGPGGGPVAGVQVSLDWPSGWASLTTNASGFYSQSGIPIGSWLIIAVRAPLSMRLAQRNWRTEQLTANLTKDFALQAGYLVSGTVVTPDGSPLSGYTWLNATPFTLIPPQDECLGEDLDYSRGTFAMVLPPDFYTLEPNERPANWYWPLTMVDLRHGDTVGIKVALSRQWRHPFDFAPPDASRITVGPPDDLGEALVTGAPGAALPLAHVLLVNLNSTHQAHAVSEADGSFTARIFAPPGSALMVKHGPGSWRWNDLAVGVSEGVNPFPGTIINLPHTHTGGQYTLPFATAGAIEYFADDFNTTRNYVGSAWAMTGTVGPVIVEGEWTRVLSGTYDGRMLGGLYLCGLNWTHPALADLDGDGDLDLVIGERSGRLIHFRNDGGSTGGFLPASWTFVTDGFAGVDTGDWAAPAFADLDGDGDLDLLVGTGQGKVAFYRRDPGDTWTLVNAAYLSVDGWNAAPAFADLDGDGDLDLLVGYIESASDQGRLSFFRCGGTDSTPTWTLVTAQYAGIVANGSALPAFSDLDGDGDLDLLVGQGGRIAHYRNDGPPTNPAWALVTSNFANIGGSSAISPVFGDLDGDGDKDLLTGEHWGRIAFYRRDGSAWTFISNDFFPFDLDGDSAPALADWDNDGDLDLLLGQAHGNIYKYTNIGSATNPNWRPDGVVLTLPWTDHPHAFPALADTDGDGDYDLFVGEGGFQGSNAGGNIHYYRNNGTRTSPIWTLVTTSFLGLDVGGWATPTFVDIDADGDLDLFVGDEAGTLTFVQNTGTRTSPTWAAPVRPYAGLDLGDYSAPAFLDVDGDGDLDLFSGRQDGALAYVRNIGTHTAPAWKLVTTQYPGLSTGDRSVPVAADLDGDGRQDMLIGDGDGGLNFYHYVGPGTPPPSPFAFAPGDAFQIEGTVRIYSPAITTTTPISGVTAGGWLHLMMLFDAQGHPLAGQNYFMSTLLTPTGFPIQRPGRASERLESHFEVTNLRYAGGHAIEGALNATGRLPEDVLPGIYRPTFWMDITGVPTSTTWLAANVVHHTFHSQEAVLPPITVGQIANLPHLFWRLLADDFVQGTRGTGAREDRGTFELASQIVTQGAPFYIPPVDVRTGHPITYRLEPFLPMISFTDRRMPTPPLLPLALPGGQMNIRIQQPDGTVRDLGTASFAQSFNRTKTTRAGNDLNIGTVQLDDVYSLKASSDQFRVTFNQSGHHVVTMTGTVADIWGNTYTGGGTYDLWVAYPLDIDPGVLPGTPFQVGNAFNPTLQVYPGVPADVSLTLTLYPNSNPAQAITYTVNGRANNFGYFDGRDAAARGHASRGLPITISQPGEYRLDLTVAYTGANGVFYMGAMTWGGVVETPNSPLIAHGRRGLDSLRHIPSAWFVSSRDLTIPAGEISHTLNPYFNGDIIWSRMSDGPWGGDSLILGASVQDTVGQIEAAIRARAERRSVALSTPGTLDERFANGEIPLFISTSSGRPAQMVPNDVDQLAYSYRTSQRPGVRVREVVAEDGQSGGYWRLDTLYDDQLSVGILGDQPNDFKFQYVGTVYRDLEDGISQYGGQGSLWIFIPDGDPTGSRVMPPFAGPGNGGWTTEGGPILKLKGQDIHIFILPTGTQPGAVLEVGDTFRFAGHIAPTLDSKIAVTVTSPSGGKYLGGGQANKVGYFYDPTDDFTVDEPGLWSVDVRVWHDGMCSGGQTVPPYPSGDVLGSDHGRYWFYVVPAGAPRLNVSTPSSGFLSFGGQVTPIAITGHVPAGLTDTVVDYTITMPGYILKHGQATVSGNTYTVVFDPVALNADFPNLDLMGRDDRLPGLADTFTIGLLLQGQSQGNVVYRANAITIQGEQVFIGGTLLDLSNRVYLPAILKGG